MFLRMTPRRCGLLALLLPAFLCAAAAHSQTTNDLRLNTLDRVNGGWTLGWQSSATGQVCTAQFQETLADGIWRVPPSLLYPLASNQWFEPVDTNLERFYRVAGVPVAQRGKLLSANYSNTLSVLQLSLYFTLYHIPITPKYNVREYKITYETITPLGARTRASGALLLPEATGTPLPLLSYQHGTITQTNEAPSSMDVATEVSIGIGIACTGYAAAVPDYLGLGSSPGLHPYHLARSEATACIDMLRAVKTFCATNGFPLTNKLFLAGYSQGGHATMALLRELETFYTNEFTVTACAPMAGAYDLSGVTTTNFLSGNPQPNPYYFLYLLAAYQDVYHLANSLADLLAPPYNTTLPPLMNGNSTAGQLNAAMPADPVQILKPEYLAAFIANPRHPLRLALQDNDCYRWKPRAPLHLYHCAADQDVIIANSEVALATFQSLGATQVVLIDPLPSTNHVGCAEPSLLDAKAWFDSLR